MEAGHPVSMLMFMTLAAALVIIVISLAYFLRKRSNRHPMEGQPERNIGAVLDEAKPAGERPSDRSPSTPSERN